jgi:enoyl-CoA hydratase/carnithine racemase
MTDSKLVITQRDSHSPVGIVRIQREERMNAFNEEIIDGLIQAAESLRDDVSLKAIVLTGGARVFSSGADFATLESLKKLPSVNAARRMAHRGSIMCKAWESLPQVTIAAMEGAVVGAGVALALACDWRVMAKEAFVCVPEVRVGVTFGWGTIPRLTTLVGPARAKRMVILCQRHAAPEMLDWGLADKVVDNGQTLDRALDLAREVAAMPALATQIVKRSINAYSTALGDIASHADMEEILLCLTDAEGEALRKRAFEAVAGKLVSPG